VKKKRPTPKPEDFELETVSLEDIEDDMNLTVEEEEDFQDFYLPPEKPLKFE
jgi:hypothetical protein